MKLTDTTNTGQSGPGNNGNTYSILKISRTGDFPSETV